MTVGEILDKALKITPKVIKSRLLLVLIYSLSTSLQVILSSSQNTSFVGLSILLSLVSGYISLMLMISAIKVGYSLWNGGSEQVDNSVGVKEVFKFIFLSIRISIVSGLYAILLFIPGIVYFTNRVLSYYILVIDKCTIKEALNKSKLLMTGEKWYKSTSPVMRLTGFIIISIIISLVTSGISVGVFTYFVAKGNYILSAPIGLVAYFLTISTSMYNVVCMLGLYQDLSNKYLGADLVGQLSSDKLAGSGAHA